VERRSCLPTTTPGSGNRHRKRARAEVRTPPEPVALGSERASSGRRAGLCGRPRARLACCLHTKAGLCRDRSASIQITEFARSASLHQRWVISRSREAISRIPDAASRGESRILVGRPPVSMSQPLEKRRGRGPDGVGNCGLPTSTGARVRHGRICLLARRTPPG
jgi:hypothetical protein